MKSQNRWEKFVALFITLIVLCITGIATVEQTQNSVPLHPDDYVLFAWNKIDIGQKSKILSGSIGVNTIDGSSKIILDQKVETPAGFYVKADDVQIKQNAIIGDRCQKCGEQSQSVNNHFRIQ